MPIPEMQQLKEKYPQYKDMDDSVLLQSVVKKYPVYSPIADREFGAIKELTPEKQAVSRGVTPREEEKLEKSYDKRYGIKKDVLGQLINEHPLAIPLIASGVGGAAFYGVSELLRKIPSLAKSNIMQQLARGGPFEEELNEAQEELTASNPEMGKKLGELRAKGAAGGVFVMDVLEQLGKFAIAAKAGRVAEVKTPQFIEQVTKDAVKGYNLPKQVYISPSKVWDILRREESLKVATAQEEELIKSLGLTGSQYREALKQGVDIEVPAEKIVSLVDKPWWAKVKNTFGISPKSSEVYRAYEGKVTGTIQKPTPKLLSDYTERLAKTELGKVLQEQMKYTGKAVEAVPLHPAEEGRKALANIFPELKANEPVTIIQPRTEQAIERVVSKYPQKVTDQKSLEDFGNKIAQDMGIQVPINWEFIKLSSKGSLSGTHYLQGDKHKITVRVSPPGTVRIVKSSPYAKEHPELAGKKWAPTQGRIKALIVHELSHITAPPKITAGMRRDVHHTTFKDEVEYWEQAGLRTTKGGKLPTVSVGQPIGEGKVIIDKGSESAGRGSIPGEPIQTYNKGKAGLFINEEGKYYIQREDGTLVYNPQTKNALFDTVEKAEKQLSTPTGTKEPAVSSKVELTKPPVYDEVNLRKIVEQGGGQYVGIQESAVPGNELVLFNDPVSKSTLALFPKDVTVESIKAKINPTVVTKTKPKVQVTKYKTNSLYHTELQTITGPSYTMLSGEQLNDIATKLANNEIPTDLRGAPVIRINDAVGIKGDAGFINLANFDDAVNMLSGFAEERSSAFSYLAKKFGTPFFIGEKYPVFKPIYQAVRNSVSYEHELFYNGSHLLNSKFLIGLSKKSQAQVLDVLRLGNIQKKVFEDAELTKQFNFTPDEIKGYHNFRRALDYATKINIEKRKLVGGFNEMPPEKQALANSHIQSQVEVFQGYFPQSRLGGNWAVFVEDNNPISPNFPYFFNLYPNKAEALAEAKLLGGNAGNVYLRRNLNPTIYGRMSIVDLENLADAAGVEEGSADLRMLVDEIKKRTFSSHWIRRKDSPGYTWDMKNAIDSVHEYLKGSTSGFAKSIGSTNATKAYVANLGQMSPELQKYATDYIKDYFSLGQIGYPLFQKMLYLWELAMKPQQLAQNLSQPMETTLSSMLKYYNIPEAQTVFLPAYDLAGRYAMYKLDSKNRGIPADLLYYLNKLQKQGELGDQMVRFMMDARHPAHQTFEAITGAAMRVGEFTNRTHAAIVGYKIATEKLKMTGKDTILEFIKNFSDTTQFSYGKHNLPTVITGSGNLKNLLRLMYTFRHYPLSNLQRIMQMSPLRGAPLRQWTSALGSALALHGWKGLAFMGLAGATWAKLTGHTMEYDVRKTLDEFGLPEKAIDLVNAGLPALAGVDITQLVGMSDIIPSYSGALESIFGASYGAGERLIKGTTMALKGDWKNASTTLPPAVLRNLFKGIRMLHEGARTMNGTLIAQPSVKDSIVQMFGFTPLSVSKGYDIREAKQTMLQHASDKKSEFYLRLAKAREEKDTTEYNKILREIEEFNKTASPGERVRSKGRRQAVRDWRRRMQGKDTNVPRGFKREFREVERVFNQEKGGVE